MTRYLKCVANTDLRLVLISARVLSPQVFRSNLQGLVGDLCVLSPFSFYLS